MEKSLLHITQVRWVEESVQPVEVTWSSVATLQSLITQLVMVEEWSSYRAIWILVEILLLYPTTQLMEVVYSLQ